MSATLLIGLDWGTSTLRAFRIGADGLVLDRREGPFGILGVQDGAFEAMLLRLAGDWLRAEPEVPVIASGMITSRQGWIETPYLPCPAGAEELARAVVTAWLADGRPLHFLPGLVSRNPGDAPDVMRGEETQIVGALTHSDDASLYVLPGTHSKWALCARGQVLRFATFLTGELYAVLRRHSILARSMEGDGLDAAAFTEGVRAGFADPGPTGGLLHRLFGVRTRGLFGQLAPEAAPSFLSGLLIGSELREAEAICGRPQRAELIGNRQLVVRYARARPSRRAVADPSRGRRRDGPCPHRSRCRPPHLTLAPSSCNRWLRHSSRASRSRYQRTTVGRNQGRPV